MYAINDLDDLKSGNFNNKVREEQMYTNANGGDFFWGIVDSEEEAIREEIDYLHKPYNI